MAETNNQSLANMAAADQPMTDIVSENDLMEIEEESNVHRALPSENAPNTNVISSSSGLGLLSLPPELRVYVYRDLLLADHPLSTYWPGSAYQPFPPIFNTCELIRREAFQVMYGENVFYIGSLHATHSILRNRQISDTIRNVQFKARLNDTSPHRCRSNFVDVIREFGSPSITRGVLSIIFRVGPYNNLSLLSWFAQSVRRFTNFRTIQIEYVAGSAHRLAEKLCPQIRDTHDLMFTPLFGPALSFASGRGLKFHPQEYLKSLPPEVDVDWMFYLDGIRLDWNQDPRGADESKASAQNPNSDDWEQRKSKHGKVGKCKRILILCGFE